MKISSVALKYLASGIYRDSWAYLRRQELSGRMNLNYIEATLADLTVNLTAYLESTTEAWEVEISGPISPDTGKFLETPNQNWKQISG